MLSDGKGRTIYPSNGSRIWTVDPKDDDIEHIGVGTNGSVYAAATGGLTTYRIDQSA
ncbi:MAG: hypothetical protein ABEH64_08170 [Salinirussus sp.]